MNIIKRFFKNIIPSNKSSKEILGGHDLDDKLEVEEEISEIVKIEVTKTEGEVKKKPGRPKGSTAKKTPSKKTPSKSTPSKKV